jgi:glycosyltransferase involved in cell wall biosynthesis
MSPRVSVIVPVYNVERYLAKCLDSLLAQTLQDLEVIVVDDGSTDSSAAVIERYRSTDSRVRVVEQRNEGLSSARNAGMARASGEFTAFVDADDWASAEMFETLHDEAIGAQADIVLCNYVKEYANRSVEKQSDLPDRVQYSPTETRSVLLRSILGPVGPQLARLENMNSFTTAWGKLYRTSLLRENSLRFIDCVEIGNEDGLFNIQAFTVARNVVFIRKALYHYRRDNPGSLTSVYRPQLQQQWERLFARIEKFLTEHSLPVECWEALSNRRAVGLFGLARNVLHNDNTMGFLSRYRKIKSLLRDTVLSAAVKNLPLSYLPFHWKMFFLLAKGRVTLPFYLMLKAADAMI